MFDPITEILGPHVKPVDITAICFWLQSQLSGFLTRTLETARQTMEGEGGSRRRAVLEEVSSFKEGLLIRR